MVESHKTFIVKHLSAQQSQRKRNYQQLTSANRLKQSTRSQLLCYLLRSSVEAHFGLPDLLGLQVLSVNHHRGFPLLHQAEVPQGVDHAGLTDNEMGGLSNHKPHLSFAAVREAH